MIRGVTETIRNMKRFEGVVSDAVLRGLSDHVDAVFSESQRLVPVETGVLQGTGRKKNPKKTHAGWSITLQYGGGPAAPYAVRQHEELDWQHDAPQQAKYLEDPAKRMSSQQVQTIERAVKKVL